MPGALMYTISLYPLNKLVNHTLFYDSWQNEHLVLLASQKRICSKNIFVGD